MCSEDSESKENKRRRISPGYGPKTRCINGGAMFMLCTVEILIMHNSYCIMHRFLAEKEGTISLEPAEMHAHYAYSS
jgi:hypothetical protein